jgi:DNA-binding NarL/FixJ family response regulator
MPTRVRTPRSGQTLPVTDSLPEVPAAHGVLIVDHWPLVRLGIAKALPATEYRVIGEVDSAEQVVAALRRSAPALVVVGNHVEGYQAEVVDKSKRSGARVLALVDRSGREQLAALASAGADGIITGSAGADELVDAARRVMAGERVLAPALLLALVGVIRPQPVRHDDITLLLTERERQVLSRLVQGAGNEAIARQLLVSPTTVKTHLSHIYAKLEVSNRHEAMARAIQLGLIA